MGEGDLVVGDDEDRVLVKGLDGLEAEGGVGGPGAGEAVCLGGEGLMLWSRRVAGGALEARGLEGLEVDVDDLEVAVEKKERSWLVSFVMPI